VEYVPLIIRVVLTIAQVLAARVFRVVLLAFVVNKQPVHQTFVTIPTKIALIPWNLLPIIRVLLMYDVFVKGAEEESLYQYQPNHQQGAVQEEGLVEVEGVRADGVLHKMNVPTLGEQVDQAMDIVIRIR
jgi:hypothetical protein